jgi:hypothetical protein
VFAHWPPARRIGLSALVALGVAVLIVTAFRGLAATYPLRLLQGLAVAAAALGVLGLLVALVTTRMGRYSEPADEEAFERLVVRSERLARENLAADPDEEEFLALDPYDPADFEELVRQALDELPDLLVRALEHVAVVISDDGRRHRAYGLYQGDSVSRKMMMRSG